jgi:hypothetical protein
MKDITYSIEQSLSWEANRVSVSQEIPRIVWNPKVHYQVYKCLPPSLSWAFMKDTEFISGAIWKEVTHYCVYKNGFISWIT